MSVLTRAAYIDAKVANQSENKMNELLDQKENDLGKQKRYNQVLDALEDARGGEKNFSVQEKEDIIMYAQKAGVDVTMNDFAAINTAHDNVARNGGKEGRLWLTKEANGAENVLTYNTELDAVKTKIQRSQKLAEDVSKGGDLKRNIAMNEYVQATKDSNSIINRIKDLGAAISPAST